jgi:ketosteroid isomerase-like protein
MTAYRQNPSDRPPLPEFAAGSDRSPFPVRDHGVDQHSNEGVRMATASEMLMNLERKFWQSIVDDDADTAINLLSEPALMVSTHGAMKFDHAQYRQMAEKGQYKLESFDLSEMQAIFPNETTAVLLYKVKETLKPRERGDAMTLEMNDTSTWVKVGSSWKCAVHTETPSSGPQH